MRFHLPPLLFSALFGLLVSGLSLPAAPLSPEADEFQSPPKEFSVMPFWFWNDELKDEEILRQIADMEEHGVHGFVIHPRIGLPKDTGWMSPKLLRAMRLAISEAAKRGMKVILYDEGMYPSGSAAGEVVARNPAHAARGLACVPLKDTEGPSLKKGEILVTELKRPSGERYAVIDRPTGGVIRGLHYLNEGEGGRLKEFLPPAGDILNPEAVKSFIELVYDRYAAEFGEFFGGTVVGIFTDEPNPLGRDVKGMVPGNSALLDKVSSILGYDIRPQLLDLWFDDNAESRARRAAYRRAVNECLEQSYYKQLSDWCAKHGIALTGHPAESTDIGTERHFHMPGQDLVWRYVVPGTKAIEGGHSTMAKCASSAMIHLGRRRNINELYGAYGHELTWDEVNWLAYWCFVRGQNLLIPHAFYYSMRGPRKDERPPDVGPNSAWWDRFTPFAKACSRLSWINTDSKQLCDTAILVDAVELPWKSAKVLFQNQRDFNYLEMRHLWEDAKVTPEGLFLAGMHYKALVIDGLDHLPPQALPAVTELARQGRLVMYGKDSSSLTIKGAVIAGDDEAFLESLDRIAPRSLSFAPKAPGLRVRQVLKQGHRYVMLFNEEETPLRTAINGLPREGCMRVDPASAHEQPFDPASVELPAHSFQLLRIADPGSQAKN